MNDLIDMVVILVLCAFWVGLCLLPLAAVIALVF